MAPTFDRLCGDLDWIVRLGVVELAGARIHFVELACHSGSISNLFCPIHSSLLAKPSIHSQQVIVALRFLRSEEAGLGGMVGER